MSPGIIQGARDIHQRRNPIYIAFPPLGYHSGRLGNDGQHQVVVDGVMEQIGLQFHCTAETCRSFIESHETLVE